MIPITPFAWRQSARKAPASIACTRQSSSAGKGPSVRPGPALITPTTCPGLRRRPRRKRNRSFQRSQKKTWVAMIPTTPFAWRPTERMVAASNAFSRRWSSASSGPPARPGPASTTRITSRHPRRRLRRRKPNRRRLSNQRSLRNRRSQRSQRNRCNYRRHRNLRNRSSAECAAPIPVGGASQRRADAGGFASGFGGSSSSRSASSYFTGGTATAKPTMRAQAHVAESGEADRHITRLRKSGVSGLK
jgi:hypothetical protein